MRTDLAGRTAQLRSGRTPYVLATVVRAERPTSAKPGDAALVLPDGSVEGFVGGTCAESTVRAYGLRLLRTGESTLLRITAEPPPPESPLSESPSSESPPSESPHSESPSLESPPSGTAPAGLVTVANPCLSGGTLEIFLQATIPPVLVRVLGDSPIAQALERIGTAMGYEVDRTTDPAASIAPDTDAVVVASHGRAEQPLLASALAAGVPYVALVASRRRGAAVLAALDRPPAEKARVRTPAGLDIGARTAPEIAVSILAELVAQRRAGAAVPVSDPAAVPVSKHAAKPEACCHA